MLLYCVEFNIALIDGTVSFSPLPCTHKLSFFASSSIVKMMLLTGLGSMPSSCYSLTPRVAGHLPLREGDSSREGPSSSPAATRLGKGASPCWQHVMRIPLPAELALADNTSGSGQFVGGSVPIPHAGASKRKLEETCPPPKALVSQSMLLGVSSWTVACRWLT